MDTKKTNILLRKFSELGLYALFSVALIILLAKCAQPMKVERFDSEITAIENHRAVAHWGINYADTVFVSSIDKGFGGYDSLVVFPTEDKEYVLTAYQKKDSLVKTIKINVLPDTSLHNATSGDYLESITKLPTSAVQSDFFVGLAHNGAGAKPSRMRIFSTVVSEQQKRSYLKALLLDDKGNFISGINPDIDSLSIIVESACGTDKMYYPVLDFSERNNTWKDGSLALGVIIDNSAGAVAAGDLLDGIHKSLFYLQPGDEFMLGYFNQDLHLAIDLTSAENAIESIKKIKIPEKSGLNSVYKSAYKALKRLSLSSAPKKQLVIATSFADNSSVIYTLEDVCKLAGELGIPITVIGIGDAFSAYYFKLLSSVTGGAYYALEAEEYESAGAVLSEIINASNHYYTFSVPFSAQPAKCEELKLKVDLNFFGEYFSDAVSAVINPPLAFSQYQSLALFAEDSSNIDSVFYESLKLFAQVLKDNPDEEIELIGNTSLEGNRLEMTELSKRRAEAVRNKLVEFGADSAKIRVKPFGSSKRVYFFEQNDWQRQLNRRVDIRWLNPATLPYEIVAETVTTENAAAAKVEKWEMLGMNAYFERYFDGDYPYYKVKIWGFATYDDAEAVRIKLSKDYSRRFSIE